MRVITLIAYIILWAFVVGFGFIALEKYTTPNVVVGDVSTLEAYLQKQFNDAVGHKRLGCGGFAIVHHGKIVAEHGFGIANFETGGRVDTDSTLFLLSSLSKAVTAWGVMKLVEEGKIQLDEPVFSYLSRWTFPGSEQYRSEVTLRHLLSHTAGFVDGYGHGGFTTEKELQTIEEALQHPEDANMGESHAAIIRHKPGTAVFYSSAGYAVIQLLIEEITGLPFEVYMQQKILSPLGMDQCRYSLQEIMNEGRGKFLATQYDLELKPHGHRYYSNMAGVSLRASIHDLALFASSYFNENGVLKMHSIDQLMEPQTGTEKAWALGHILYNRKSEKTSVIAGHGGGAFPASGSDMRISASSGNAIVLVASGSQNFISRLADDWMYWETGIKPFDIRNVVSKYMTSALVIFLMGVGFILWITNRKKDRRDVESIS